MRAKDFIELNNKYQFYDELRQVIDELSKRRKNRLATEIYYNSNLIQDKIKERYEAVRADLKLNGSDIDSKPVNVENKLGISDQQAYNFRNHLFEVVKSDKSFGYLFYLLASERNREDFSFIDHPIDCIPDEKVIEKAIFNSQDDYPKHNLTAYLTYCSFNSSYYQTHKKSTQTQEFWFSVFTDAYSLFDVLRTKMTTPFEAIDLIKEHFKNDYTGITIIIPLVSELLQRYDYDLTEEQRINKEILVYEINSYLESYNQNYSNKPLSSDNDSLNKNQNGNDLERNLIVEEKRENNTETVAKTKAELLKENLHKYGFFELDTVKNLSPKSQSTLIQKFITKKIPYTIAMLDHLGYFKLLDSDYFGTIKERNIHIADWLTTDERNIRGNKNVLDLGSTENKTRYTAHKHKEKVINDYEQLKTGVLLT